MVGCRATPLVARNARYEMSRIGWFHMDAQDTTVAAQNTGSYQFVYDPSGRDMPPRPPPLVTSVI